MHTALTGWFGERADEYLGLSSLFRGDSRDAAAANLLLTGGFQAPALASKVAHSREASVRAPYGGRGVKWMAFMVLFLQRGVGTEMWLRLAGRSGRPRVSRRWSASYAGAGYPKTLVSSHVRCLFSSASAGLAVAHGHAADWCARCRGARAASPAATDVDRGGQSEALILLVVDLGFCGTEEACVRGSLAGTDAGGMRSG